MRRFRIFTLACIALTACTPLPPVDQSREALWQQFGHHSIDDVLLAWGAPAAETRLTNNARMVTYHHAHVYDADSPYERSTGCEVSFLAPPPHYRIENISMQGKPRECALLAQGRTGVHRIPYVPPPYPYYRYPF